MLLSYASASSPSSFDLISWNEWVVEPGRPIWPFFTFLSYTRSHHQINSNAISTNTLFLYHFFLEYQRSKISVLDYIFVLIRWTICFPVLSPGSVANKGLRITATTQSRWRILRPPPAVSISTSSSKMLNRWKMSSRSWRGSTRNSSPLTSRARLCTTPKPYGTCVLGWTLTSAQLWRRRSWSRSGWRPWTGPTRRIGVCRGVGRVHRRTGRGRPWSAGWGRSCRIRWRVLMSWDRRFRRSTGRPFRGGILRSPEKIPMRRSWIAWFQRVSSMVDS